MNKQIIIIALQILVIYNISGQQTTNWENFRGNSQLTGYLNIDIPNNVDIKWMYKTGSEVKSSPVAKNNKIIIGSTDGYVYCLNMQGKLVWKFNTGNAIEASALIYDQNVIIGNLSGSLFSLKLDDGIKNWEYKTENQIMAAPNCWTSGNKSYILVGSYDYYLHCIDARTGKGAWKYESNNYLNASVAIHENRAVFGGCDGFLHLVNIPDGKAEAKIEIATYVAGSACLDNGFAYVGDYDGGFSCINLGEKKISWKWSDEKTGLPFIASPSVYNNKVIIGNRNKHVYCFNKNSGELLWKTNTGERVDASALVTSTKVLVTNMRGDILLLDLKDGKILWSYELGSPIFSNPAVIDGKIIVGAQDGNIYCLGN